MSDRKLFGIFSGAQITILGALAIITPGAVYAVTYTSVVVTDPVTGKQALVDAGRRLYVYDPIAGYANNPQNLVQISGSTAPTNSYIVIYTVPVGRALILKSANLSYYGGAAGADNYAYFKTSGNFITGYDQPNTSGVLSSNLGSGYYIHSGDTISYYSTTDIAFSLEGYLVPATAVPLAGTPQSAEQSVSVTGGLRINK